MTVMTLDAGGTNFVFSAIKDAEEVVKPVHMPAMGQDLELCLSNIIAGFEAVKEQVIDPPEAISFAFPGPADYENGIIGDLSNLPGFRGGVALGPMLESHFGIPVFINNDGDLFAYGEAMHGLLPHVNARLNETGSSKKYHNLVGFTLGTGFGGGLVRNNELIIGDNGAAGEVWLLRNPFNNNSFAEESISARAITGEYASQSGVDVSGLMPFDVFQIAKSTQPGDQDAALASFRKFGAALGMAMAEIITVMDGLVVIGGGLANAWELFAKAMFDELNGFLQDTKGYPVPRLVMKTYNLEEDNSFLALARGQETRVKVPFSNREVTYDPMKRTGIGLSRLGTSKAVALGAYAFAVNKLT